MERAANASPPETASPLAVLRVWSLHLLAIVIPLVTLAFVLTGPHRAWASVPWLSAIAILWALDRWAGPAPHRPIEGMPSAPFDAMLLALVALQLANVALFARMIAIEGLFSMDVLVGAILVGANSGYSAIVVAHE